MPVWVINTWLILNPWKLIKTDEQRVKTILNISLQITANLTILLDPFLPFSMKKLRGFISFHETGWEFLGRKDLLEAGHQIHKAGLLFEKIEDEQIQYQMEKLINTRKKNNSQKEPVREEKPEISFEDFTKMDIRTATIIHAEKVPATKKLIKMQVDTGMDRRTIVSGIAEFFNPEDLKGKKVCVLTNLAPRKIKGIESQGMILLSENPDGTLHFISPSEEAINGAEVN